MTPPPRLRLWLPSFLRSLCLCFSLSLSLKSILSSLLMVIESVLYCCIYRFYAVVWCCAWNLLVLTCFCFCRSSGCALDCCPLSRHCPLDPKAVWLPLQATVPMATFHSHLFSIWLWHIHLEMDTEITVNNNHAPARTGRQKSIFTVFSNSGVLSCIWSINSKCWNVYMPNDSICVSCGSCWV